MVIKISYTEEELIQALRKRNGMALNYLYDQYSAALNGVILRIVGNETIAQEVLQDTLVKVWNRIEQYDSKKGKLFTWMLNIARNQAIDKTRSREFKQNQKSESIESVVYENRADSSNFNTNDFIGIPEVIRQLPEEQQYVLNEIYFKGYSHAELADESGIPLGTIKTRVRNALKKLRLVLAERE